MSLNREGKGKLKMVITEADTKSGSTAIFGPVRLSHMHVFKPRLNKLRKCDEYSVVALIQKGDDELLKFVRERINHGLTKVFGKVLAKFDSCLKDGDTETDENGQPKYPGFMFIATRADLDQAPILISPKGTELGLADTGGFVSGHWGYIKLDMFGYDNERKGVSSRVKAIQFSAKDAAFGKGPQDAKQTASEFGDVEGVEEEQGESFLD
jgi:hypothetical protein